MGTDGTNVYILTHRHATQVKGVEVYVFVLVLYGRKPLGRIKGSMQV